MAKAANQTYIFEFDESEVWFNNDDNFTPTPFDPASKKLIVPASSRSTKKMKERKTASSSVNCASSLPVNVPDWSKIYKGSNGGYALDQYHDQESDDDDHAGSGGGDGRESRVPPHEFLARRRGASFSVHEGVGRTLKGRDLRQVRNAIWKKVGFED